MLSQSQSLTQDLHLDQKQALYLPLESIGELALLSLHRIKNRIRTMPVNSDLQKIIIGELIQQNQTYRNETGNDWNCITPLGLDAAIDGTSANLEKKLYTSFGLIDDKALKAQLYKALTEQKDVQIGIAKKWFSDQYDAILYDTNGNIPYPIVKAMRSQLAAWAFNNTNPFSNDIREFIRETANSLNVASAGEDEEKLWEELKKYK